MRLGRVFVFTSCLAIGAACVSTEGLDAPPTGAPDASSDTEPTPDAPGDTATALEDAEAGGIDVLSVDGGGKLSDLRELFAAPLDPSLWSVWVPAPYSYSQASEQLHFFCTTKVTNNSLAYIRTSRWFDATVSSVHVNLVTAGAAGVTSETNRSYFWMKMRDAKSSNAVEIGVGQGVIYAKRFLGGAETNVKAGQYLPATMVWLRLRTTTTAMMWETAQSVTGTWDVLHEEPLQMAVDTVTLELGIGGFPGTPGEIILDSVNGP